MSLLELRGVNAGYGRVVAVRDINLTLEPGHVLAIVGPNGAGKTTLLNTIAGLLSPLAGTITLDGAPLPPGHPTTANRSGIVLVPDDRALFFNLTAEKNVELARSRGSAPAASMLELFPPLEKRWKIKAGALSGGEQQMLAMARALIQQPRILLVDEMSLGLAPVIIESLLPIVRRIVEGGTSAVVLVEQHVHLGLSVADEVMVLSHGEAILQSDASEVRDRPEMLEDAYLGTATRG
ncbi:MAG: transporter related protein [Acidimicrobiia bacterium]|nr:transporter related protein [Acidimicrobiia bacterium]